MSVSTLIVGLNVVSSVSICLVTLGTVVGLVDFYFIFINFTVKVNKGNCQCILNALLSCSTVILICFLCSHVFELNKWRQVCTLTY